MEACFVCGVFVMHPPTPAEYRRDERMRRSTIALCDDHRRGFVPPGIVRKRLVVRDMPEVFDAGAVQPVGEIVVERRRKENGPAPSSASTLSGEARERGRGGGQSITCRVCPASV
jgi:hypothetical protein